MMTREQFLNDLNAALSGMKEEELEGVVSYYSEMIDDRMEAGMTEEAAVKAMEPVREIASRVLEEAGVNEPRVEKDEKNDDRQEIVRPAEAVRELHIQAENKRIKITSEDDIHDIRLRYSIGSNDIFRLHEDDGILTLEHKMRPITSFANEKGGDSLTLESILNGVGKFIASLGERVVNNSWFSGEAQENEIEITLPKTFCARLEAATRNGRILAEDVTFTQPLRLTTSNAFIEAQNLNCAQDITFTTSNSKIVLDDVNVNGGKLSTSNGRIVLDDMIVREELIAVSSNAAIRISDCQIGAGLAASTSNGAIELDSVSCPDITLKTSNGSISGTVQGNSDEYTVVSGTSNGSNQLGNFGAGEKKLRAMTSNASITLKFEE